VTAGEKKIAALWKRFRASKDRDARDALVEHYLPLVRSVAGRLAMNLPSYVSEEDLYGSGCMGLLGAVDRFDPARRVKFETFASVRVRGAMLDELRGLDLLTRGVRERAARIREASNALVEEDAALSTQSLAERAGLSVQDVLDTELALRTAEVSSIDEFSDEEGHTVAALVADARAESPGAPVERAELMQLVEENLSDRDRLLVVLYYYEELTLREIGAVLGVTEGRVSQMHTELLRRLRCILERGGRA